jgi:hypothetical protein
MRFKKQLKIWKLMVFDKYQGIIVKSIQAELVK